MTSGFLVSPRWDGAFILGPPLLCAALSLAIPPGVEGGFAAWLLLVVAIDVAHVWSTLYRTWLDPVERSSRQTLLIATPLVAAAGCISLSVAAPTWFWTALAYLAVFHFLRQPIGFAALYRLRAGLPPRDAEARLERVALTALMLGPVIWWHSRLPRPFAWFTADDFLVGLPAPVGDAALAVAAALGIAWAAARWRSRRRNPGGDLWVLGTAATWWIGIVFARSDLAFTLTNVVAHGIPYLALVGWVGGRRWATVPPGPARAAWFSGPGWLAFAIVPLVFAIGEEWLWEGLVWGENALSSTSLRLAIGFLAVPQVTHYLLDGFLWKLGPSNPTLQAAVSGARGTG